jgi:predicted P-loop ATPase
MSSPKGRQDEIKDIGGYVGGYINGGRRKAANITSRTLITLDVDHGTLDVWEDFQLVYGNAALVYSTHKHSAEKPRLRIVIPLDREVLSDEYEAIARRIADHLGINNFDDSTFEACRLMYWPSTASDGEYIFDCLDAPWLSADEILGTYTNWKDTSSWPTSDRVREIVVREIKKQGDPLEKTGIVGAFCKTYNINEAIEAFLTDIYEPAPDGRYTYKGGSTSGGLVVYEGKYAYSHHGTDPIGGKLCNPFDLVRLHLFGEKDEDVKEKTNITKYPSYIAMEEFALKDKGVHREMIEIRRQEARADFAELLEEGEEPDDGWMDELDIDRKGNILSTQGNILRILENDPKLKGLIANDLFAGRTMLTRLPFWRKKSDTVLALDDTDAAELRIYLAGEPWRIKGRPEVQDAILSVAAKNAYHPVKDYLKGLTWDGKKRVEKVFIEGLGAHDSEFTRKATRAMLVGAVGRVTCPGSLMDYALVLVGEEGQGKSKLLAKLAKKPEWFADSFTVEGKEAYENLRGKWIVEMAELVALKRSDPSVIKNFLSKTSDFYRAAYDRYPQDRARQCVFFGSGNEKQFLRGIGGDRRFWPVEISAARKTKNWDRFTDHDIDQIWAEAKTYFEAGEKPMLPEGVETEARKKQTEHIEMDPWDDDITDFLERLIPSNWRELELVDLDNPIEDDPFGDILPLKEKRDSVTTKEIWRLCFRERKPIGYQEGRRIANLMNRRTDWEYRPHRRGGRAGKLVRGWVHKKQEGDEEE